MVTLQKLQEQAQVAVELEELAKKAIETMDLAVLGEYGDMFTHHSFWTLPKDFEKTENMQIASKLYLKHMDEANKAYFEGGD